MKNSSMRKLIAVLMGLLILLPAALFAAPVVVTWEWLMDDPDVTAFRYQLDGEDPSGWTVVDTSVTSYTVEGLEGSVSHSLYLQQSYDGENWSASAVSVVEPLVVEPAQEPEEAPAASDAVSEASVVPEQETASAPETFEPTAEVVQEPVEEQPAAEPLAVAEPIEGQPVAEPDQEELPVVEPVEETPVAAVVEPAKKSATSASTFSFGIDLAGGAMVNRWLPAGDSRGLSDLSPTASISLRFNNIYGLSRSLGLGARIDLGYALMIEGGWKAFVQDFFSDPIATMKDSANHHVGVVGLLPKLDIALGKKAALALEAGAEMYFSYPSIKPADPQGKVGIDWGFAGGLQFDYMLNDWFSLGLNARYHYIMDYRQYLDGRLVLGFHF